MSIVAVVVIALIIIGAGLFAGFAFESFLMGLVGAVAAGLIVGGLAWTVHLGYSNPRDLTCHVTDKDRAARDGGSDMRVYTDECGVLKVQDLFWAGEFSSSDTFAAIEPGRTYRFHVTGIRMPVFSVFPNIRTAQVVA